MFPKEDPYVVCLQECLTASFDANGTFDGDTFFRKWFREKGKTYTFIFKENLSRTNIQFAELFALIQVHAQPRDTHGADIQVQFRDRQAVLNGLNEIVRHLASTITPPERVSKYIAYLYGHSMRPAIVVEAFHGSCTVFVPPHIELDLPLICAESGYIHSCGMSIYTRPLDTALESSLFVDLRRYLSAKASDKKLLFVVYCHEDFTGDDSTGTSHVPGSVTDLRIHIEKLFLKDKRLVDVLHRMREEFNDYLVVPAPGYYLEEHQLIRHAGEVDESHSLGLIVDRAIGRNSRQAGLDRYMICYDQLFSNDNPFHIFDENKPAWVSHTTMPHTLTGAMINITRPAWPRKHVEIGDPFAGTGTTWLELCKFDGVVIDCADKEAISPLLLKDNLNFFSMTGDQLKTLKRFIDEFGTTVVQPPKRYNIPNSARVADLFRKAVEYFEQLDFDSSEATPTIPGRVAHGLAKEEFQSRLLFYLLLRTHVRHIGGLRRKPEAWMEFFRKEVGLLHGQIDKLLALRQSEVIEHFGASDQFIKCAGYYSQSCTVSRERLQQMMAEPVQGKGVSVRDATRAVLPKDGHRLDVVITDPPYGFNTEDESRELAKVYTKAIRVMLERLANGGQLVLSLPERSHSGRAIPAFTRRRWVTQQVLAEAARHELEPILPAVVVPDPSHLFWPPYYWESERALGRSILHFTFRRRHQLSPSPDSASTASSSEKA